MAAVKYVRTDVLERMTARELVQLRRAGGPAELVDALELELGSRRAGVAGDHNRRRASLYFLAEFYAWSARRPETPVGNDPRDGRQWPRFDRLGMAIARAENTAAARVTYAAARRQASPFARLAELEQQARR